MSTIKTQVGGAILAVDEQLKDWAIIKPNSTMIAYIAVNSPEKKLFIQWQNGTGNIYTDVPMLTLTGIVTAPSSGKFFHAYVKDKFDTEKVEKPLISLAPEDEELDFSNDFGSDDDISEDDYADDSDNDLNW